MRSIIRNLIALALILASCGALLAQSQSANILHTPVAFSLKREAIIMQAQLDGDQTGTTVREAKVWFKQSYLTTWDYVEMTSTPDGFKAEIPEYATGDNQLSYYIEFTCVVGGTETPVTYPAQNPQTAPLNIALKSPPPSEKALNAQGSTGLTLLSPMPKSSVPAGDLLIMVMINPKERILRKEDLSLKVDGKEVIQDAEITEEMLTVFVKDVKEGSHRLDFNSKRSKEPIYRFLFTSGEAPAGGAAPTGSKTPQGAPAKPKKLWGNIGASYSSQDLNGVEHTVTREWASIGGKSGLWRFNVKADLSSEEDKKLQPQNRYSVELGMGILSLRFLDVYPRYNELVLWGKRTRGGEFDLRGGAGSFSLVYGEILRPVDSEITGIDTVWNSADPTLVDRVDSTFNRGTYKRWMGAMRFSIGDPNDFNIGLTTMKVKDDPTSILYGVKPKDNIVGGIDLQFYMFKRRLSFNSDVAWSLYNDNINDPAFESTESIKNIIWINQNFSPTPADTSTDKATVIKNAVKNTLSHKSELGLRVLGNDFSVGYYSYAKSFHTLAMPQIATDRQGFFVRDQIQFWNGKVYLSGGFNQNTDNLSGKSPLTNTNSTWDAALTFYMGGPYVPDLSFNISSQNNTNDGDSILAAQRIDNSNGSMGFNLTKEYALLGSKNRFSFGMNTSTGEDQYDSLNTSEQSMWNFGLINKQAAFPLTTTLNYASSTSESFNGRTNMEFSNTSLIFRYELLNGKLRPWFSPRMSSKSGSNNVSPTSPRDNYILMGMDLTDPNVAALVDTLTLKTVRDVVLDMSQLDWTAGLEWEFLPRHDLRVDFRLTSYSSSNKNRYWNGAEYDAAAETITNTDGVRTVTFNQASAGARKDDLVMLLGYSYRF